MTNSEEYANKTDQRTRKFIRNRMEETGITQYHLSQLTGLSQSTIGRWLKGEASITYPNFLKILEALDVNQYLIPKEHGHNQMVKLFIESDTGKS